VNQKLGAEVLEVLQKEYGESNVHFTYCDVTSTESVAHLWDQTVAHFGVDCVDVWVNNAGVMGEKEGWEKCLDINLIGVLNGIY
jgi:NAD(P)-dependent dehydrogenase (short-subunit alcohol dehydrogenase family)